MGALYTPPYSATLRSLLVTSGGDVWGFGRNSDGQLGVGWALSGFSSRLELRV